MSKILITGNGFDLFHGLPTKYGHFMAIMETIEKYGFKKDISFEDLFERYFKDRFSNDYELIKEKYKTENINFDNEKVNELAKLLSSNSWYRHFKNVNNIETWIDFEIEIENIIVSLSKVFNHIKTKFDIDYYDKDVTRVYTSFGCFGFIIREDGQYGYFKVEYLDKKNKKVKEKEILNELGSSMEEFIAIFNKYLVLIVYPFYNQFHKSYSIPFYLVNKIYTFNFTPTFERLYSIESSKIDYLHGKSSEIDHLQNLVLGVSEINDDIKINKMFNFTKYYQKVVKKANPKFIEVPEQATTQLEETTFLMIGHSLDESDREYIKDIFDFLLKDLKKRSKICIFYYDLKDKESKTKNLFNIIQKEIIVNLNRQDRLYFSELSEENIREEIEKKKTKSDIYI